MIPLAHLHKGLGRNRFLLLLFIPIGDRPGELGYQPDIRSGSLGRRGRDRQKGGSHPQTNNSEQAQDSRLHLSFLHAEIPLIGSSSSRLCTSATATGSRRPLTRISFLPPVTTPGPAATMVSELATMVQPSSLVRDSRRDAVFTVSP